MDFGLSEEQEMLQDTVRGFIDGECPTTRMREIFDRGDGFDPALWKGLVEMGLVGLAIDEAHGGGGLELLDLALVQEVMGERGLPGPFMTHALSAHAVSLAGSAAQKQRWLPSMVEGELATIALCEGLDGWTPGHWRTRREGDRLSGVKAYVPHADVAQRFVVGLEHGELVMVEADAPGLHVEPLDGLDRSRPIHRVSFDGTPCEPLEAGGDAADRLLDAGLCLLAADAFGAASHLIDITVAYAQTREQFGQKIAEFQSVKHQLARLGTDIEPTRALYWYAAHAFDHIDSDRARSAALAKAHITDRAVAAGRMCVELHGGLGFTWECDVQIWLKRCLFDRAFLGSPPALRARCADLAGW